MMVGMQPSFRLMREPYFSERNWSERYGCSPNWWRLPMIGSLDGPGGSLGIGQVALTHKNTAIRIRRIHE